LTAMSLKPRKSGQLQWIAAIWGEGRNLLEFLEEGWGDALHLY
jgi:hypothetical protein